MNELKEIMTRKELAMYLQKDPKTIYRYEAKGLRPIKIERGVYYKKEDILDFFEKEGNKTK